VVVAGENLSPGRVSAVLHTRLPPVSFVHRCQETRRQQQATNDKRLLLEERIDDVPDLANEVGDKTENREDGKTDSNDSSLNRSDLLRHGSTPNGRDVRTSPF
jgi:hypothetical protein